MKTNETINETVLDSIPASTPEPTLQPLPFNLVPKIDMVPHTMFLFCGPTSSGKSTFAEDLSAMAETLQLTCEIISSDGLRKELLIQSNLSPYAAAVGSNKYSDAMSSVSKQAFDLLMTKLQAFTSYPINTEVVVVDTTGMDEVFRKQVKDIAEGNGYKTVLVTFDYKYRSDYIPKDASYEAKFIIDKAVSKYRQKVLPALTNRDFDGRVRIKSTQAFAWWKKEETFDAEGKDVIEAWVEAATTDKTKEKIELALSCQELGYRGETEEPVQMFAVIGDTHECTEELKLMIEVINKKFPGSRIVHIGDYLDKGGDTKNMVEYMFERLSAGDIFIQGNHEAFVARRLLGELTPLPEVEAEYFSSLKVLSEDVELAKKFLNIYDASKPFALLCDFSEDGGIPVIVTHAPCHSKYLSKVHDDALRAQRNYRTIDRTKPVLEEFAWLYKDANHSHPVHIFGHIAHKATDFKSYKFRNKVFLDSGVVYGGKLSAAIVKGGKVVDILSVDALRTRVEADLPVGLGYGPSTTKPFNLADYDLDRRDFRLLHDIMEKNVKYISGTMAPAPSSDVALEPLMSAINYYKKLGVTHVVMQPKYMGSRCQMYFFEEGPEKTFAVSRAGWVIKGVHGKSKEEYDQFLVAEWEKRKDMLAMYGDFILDGELLPWYALGSGLIEEAFTPYQELIRKEIDILESDTELKQLEGFCEYLNLSGKKDHLAKFTEVLGRYGKPGEPEFRAFDILWSAKDSSELQKTSYGKFRRVNDDVCEYINVNAGPDIERAQEFFKLLSVERGMEGVVMKPLNEHECDLPYMKIRSEEYLRLVYGYDYLEPSRYNRLVRQKNISGKVRLSISEHKAAKRMLTAEGDAKKEIIIRLIGQMKEEKVLDPRL